MGVGWGGVALVQACRAGRHATFRVAEDRLTARSDLGAGASTPRAKATPYLRQRCYT